MVLTTSAQLKAVLLKKNSASKISKALKVLTTSTNLLALCWMRAKEVISSRHVNGHRITPHGYQSHDRVQALVNMSKRNVRDKRTVNT
jgi:hypothetical protein